MSSKTVTKHKKSSFFGTRIFLSKPQAWHIIAARSAVYIIKGGKPPLMIYRNKLRMIYKAYAFLFTFFFLIRLCVAIVPPIPTAAPMPPARIK